MAMQTSITGFVAVSALALASALVAAAPRAHAQDACTEVRVMATAGPEAEFAAKTAKEDFERATGIKVVFDTVSRDI